LPEELLKYTLDKLSTPFIILPNSCHCFLCGNNHYLLGVKMKSALPTYVRRPTKLRHYRDLKLPLHPRSTMGENLIVFARRK